jgi:hypothetical protein
MGVCSWLGLGRVASGWRAIFDVEAVGDEGDKGLGERMRKRRGKGRTWMGGSCRGT